MRGVRLPGGGGGWSVVGYRVLLSCWACSSGRGDHVETGKPSLHVYTYTWHIYPHAHGGGKRRMRRCAVVMKHLRKDVSGAMKCSTFFSGCLCSVTSRCCWKRRCPSFFFISPKEKSVRCVPWRGLVALLVCTALPGRKGILGQEPIDGVFMDCSSTRARTPRDTHHGGTKHSRELWCAVQHCMWRPSSLCPTLFGVCAPPPRPPSAAWFSSPPGYAQRVDRPKRGSGCPWRWSLPHF